MSACQVGGAGRGHGSLVPLTFCCDPAVWPGPKRVCSTSPTQKGPARACPSPTADSALNSPRNPREAGAGRSCPAGTPASVGKVSPRTDMTLELLQADGCGLQVPQVGSWHTVGHRSHHGPWPSSAVGAGSQACSLGEAPERPRWGVGLGCGRAGAACSWREGGSGVSGGPGHQEGWSH